MIKTLSSLALACLAVIVIASCSSDDGGPAKKVVILSNGELTLDESKQKIRQEPSNRHTEETLEFTTEKVTLEVDNGSSKKNYDLTEDGMYILNLKVDTIVGGLVKYSDSGRASSISAEELERMIDSTRQMIEGKNTSDDKKTYFILPGNIKKISADAGVRVIGPYKGIPYKVDVDESGKPIEIYKFFTNKQKREVLDDMLKRFGR
ncbi:MAG TPA: hypothetical protein VD993_16680 [Chitinophagaceae bacterium]|nr:hypothetical protein [Chitinophagaceae bacterium]